ncbi:hypothetical protein A2U01_0110651, partial [Trifolium medium]|nr:hypothetical protein [Trifolium medium]
MVLAEEVVEIGVTLMPPEEGEEVVDMNMDDDTF